MITIEQCRAARGLLGWTQQELANATGLSKTAINNFERGLSDVKSETLRMIRDAFDQADIEMLGDYGVRKRSDSVNVLKGPDALELLWDDIFDTLKDNGGEVLVTNVDERRSEQHNPAKLRQHIQRLADYNITERLLSCEGDDYFLQPVHYYRWIPKDVFRASMTSFIYGDKVALELWQEAMILIIQSPAASEAERQRFEYLWQSAVTPPHVDGPRTIHTQEGARA